MHPREASLLNFLKPRKLETVHSVRTITEQSSITQSALEKRKSVEICVIDDNRFQPMNNLQNAGFKITEIGDVKNISEVLPFSIVLCDLMGVGSHLDPKTQGPAIISEIKLNYPTKIVIAYTGASQQSVQARAAKVSADRFFRKDSDISAWRELLDPYVAESLDPFKLWMRFRAHLVQQEIDTYLLLRLEDSFVKSIKMRDSDFRLMSSLLEQDEFAHLKNAVLGLLATGTLKVLLGSL